MPVVKERKKNAWKNVKKNGLMSAAVRVLSRQGVSGLTMDDVAMEAGVAKGTLYVYFKNKQELLKELVETATAPMVEELTTILESKDSPRARLCSMTQRHLSYFDEHREFFRVFVHDRMTSLQRMKRYRNNRYQTFVNAIAKVLQTGIEQGEFRSLDPYKVASMWTESNIAMIHLRLLSENPGSSESDAALICDVLLRGISSESAHQEKQ
jgi:TetR/AcrR family transcriptional regulator, fatty acid metabolism regulator protein